VVSSYNNSYYGAVFVIIFLLLLTAGFVFEFGKGALKISSKQTGYLASSNQEVNLSKDKLNLYTSPRKFHSTQRCSASPRVPAKSRSYSTRAISPQIVYPNPDTDKVRVLTENYYLTLCIQHKPVKIF
jgi:hypothetical protein